MTQRVVTVVILSLLLAAGVISAQRSSAHDPLMPESDIIFAHIKHIDLTCTDCHADIASSRQAADRNFPAMETCGGCHDVEDAENCGQCHKNPEEPAASPHPDRSLLFSHATHIERGADCADCHGDIAESEHSANEFMPGMTECFACHDGAKADNGCATCHGEELTLADIHPGEWRHQHDQLATFERDWCMQCHQRDLGCLECHRGDNLLGNIHDVNYRYIHGLDAKSKQIDCASCHDTRSFCVECHQAEHRIPLLHSTIAWLTDHGEAARRDVETCAACHDTADPTCSRGGCHEDSDGLRGTNPRFHAPGMTMFDVKGPWHSDDGYYCYQCHVNTYQGGEGFCGYCHGDED